MKINDIVLNEGPWDVIKGAAKGAWAGAKSQVGQQGQINRQKSEHEKEINSNNSIIYRDWMGKVEPQLKNKDPKYYYAQLKKYITSQYGGGAGGVDPTGIANNVQDPTTVDDASIKNVINQVTRNYFAKKAGIEDPASAAPGTPPPAAPGTPPPPAAAPKTGTPRQRGPNGRFTPKAGSPTASGTPPAPGTPPAAAPKPAAPGTPPAAAPKPAAPGTPPAAAPKPAAPGTPPAAAPVTFDSVKQSLAGLSKKEKQKVLTQLLSDLGTPVNK